MLYRKKHLLFKKQADIIRALAHPIRIAIADLLKNGEQCVCDIADSVGAERSNVSRHLAVMVNSGVLSYRKEGLKIIYRLKCPCITEFLNCVKEVLKTQAKENRELLRAI